MVMLLSFREDGVAQSKPIPLVGVWQITQARSGTDEDITE
jgi:hypothetical protein